MEILTLDNIITIVGLFTGGGLGAFFTWRYAKRKARAEAVQAEAEAEKAKADAATAANQATREMQDMYQQLISDIKTDRDEQKQYIQELKEDRQHLRRDRDELRQRQERLEETVRDLQEQVARNGRIVRSMRPFMCGRKDCPDRVPVTISDEGDAERRKEQPKDIEPINIRPE